MGSDPNDRGSRRPEGPGVTPRLALYAAALMCFVLGLDVAAILEGSFPLRLSIAIAAVLLALVFAGFACRARGE
jgi:hypothetical protein